MSAAAVPPASVRRFRHPLQLELVGSLVRLDELQPEWDALVRAMPRPSPFLLHAWLTEWWREYGGSAELAVALARRDGVLVGALPMMVRRRAGVRVLEFVGGRHAVLSDALLATDEDPDLIGHLVDELSTGGYDAVDLFGLPTGSRLAASGSLALRLLPRLEAPVLNIEAGWDATYRAKTTSKKRSHHRRRRRQLAEFGPPETQVVRDPDRLPAALEEAFRLHTLRFADRPDASQFTTPSGRRFHRAALRRLAADDVPRIVFLRVAGKPVAFHYYFALAGTMYVHCLAFDPAYARVSPGLLNTLDAIEAAADEGLTKVEFLGRDERYKLELADGWEPLERALAAVRSPLGTAYVSASIWEERLRRATRRNPTIRRFYVEGLAPARRLSRRVRSRSAVED